MSVNIRWLSHSLYINNTYCLTNSWTSFYRFGIEENIEFLISQRNIFHYLGDDFKNILNRKIDIYLYFYKQNKTQQYKLNLDNIILFFINRQIKVLDKYSYYTNVSRCIEIPKEMGINDIDLMNLAEQAYYFYYLDIDGYIGEEKRKQINKKIVLIPFSLYISLLIFIINLICYIYYILFLNNIEKIFLDELINLNSINYENYIRKLNEIKKQLNNDNINNNNSEEEIKNDNNSYSKNDISKETDLSKKPKNKTIKKKKDKFNIIHYKKKKLKIMFNYFSRKNLFFGIKVLLLMIISLSYFIVSIAYTFKNKNSYVAFDLIYNSLENVFKEAYNIFLPIKRQLDFYERNLINCNTLGNFYKMDLPKLNEIKTPKIENLIMSIIDDNDFKIETKNKFNSIFNKDICYDTNQSEQSINYCKNFWSGILLKGMRQAIIQIGAAISNTLDELESINDINSNRTLFSLMNDSSFFAYQIFHEFYLFRVYNNVKNIFTQLIEEKLNSIFKSMKYILFLYIIVNVLISSFLAFFIYQYKNLFYSFLNFIGIIPEKYFKEDNKIYKTIIKYGTNLFE